MTAEDYILIMLLCDGMASDEELLALFAVDALSDVTQESEHKKYECFNLANFGSVEFKKFFHFKKKRHPNIMYPPENSR